MSARRGSREVVESSYIPAHPYPSLGGVAEIAREFGVRPTAVSNWDARRSGNGFPQPVARLDMGPVYDMDAVRSWRRGRYSVAVDSDA